LIQLIQTDKTNPSINKSLELKTDAQTLKILKTSCYDCHSYETKYPKYSYIAPMSWLIKRNINNGRDSLNYSTWKNIDDDMKLKRLKRTIQLTQNGLMPKPEYTAVFHKDALLNKKQKEIVIKWAQNEIEQIENQTKEEINR
jgi:hypothetical protein